MKKGVPNWRPQGKTKEGLAPPKVGVNERVPPVKTGGAPQAVPVHPLPGLWKSKVGVLGR